MGERTGIGWTDATWNPVVGCTQVSPGCANCYAKQLHHKRHKAHQAGKLQNVPQYAEPFETVQQFADRLDQPLRWRRPRRIFVNSLSDLFHEDLPDEFIALVFAYMAYARQHTFQILTKRPKRARVLLGSESFGDLFEDALDEASADAEEILARRGEFDVLERRTDDIRAFDPQLPLPNVWLGVSVENQRLARERVPLLLQTPAAVRFLSCEPLLDRIELGSLACLDDYDSYDMLNGLTGVRESLVTSQDDVEDPGPPWPGIDWVIVGGESGPAKRRRAMNIEWMTNLVAQCDQYKVPIFIKQDSHSKDGQQGRIPDELWAHKEFPR
jgi:protein gp37